MTIEKPLMTHITERIDSGLHDLPVFHTVALRLQQKLRVRTTRIEEVTELIIEDQALAGQVLKLANAPYYSGLSKISTIKDAVVRLGAQEIANLAMLASQIEFHKSHNSMLDSYMKGLWAHSLSCAMGAKWLARKAGYGDLALEAFMGGLLHDIGKLALLKILDDIDRTGGFPAGFSEILINEILDRMHEDVGHRLMVSWSLPESYCNIAINHHGETFDTTDILLVIVRLADLACKKVGLALDATPYASLDATPEAQLLGMKEIALAELEIAIEDAMVTLGQGSSQPISA